MKPDECQKFANLMKQLANPLRMAILFTLKLGKRSVTELIEITGAKQSYISIQLNQLYNLNIVSRAGLGGKNYYYLIDGTIKDILVYLETCDLKTQNNNNDDIEKVGISING